MNGDNVKRTLWGLATPRPLRPLWTLLELGLDFEHQKVGPRSPEMDDPDFVALNPRHLVPYYVDDQVSMGESSAISIYLADRYGDSLLPMPTPGTAERAMLQERTMFLMMEVDARLYTVRLHGDPPAGLSNIYGAAPAAVEAAKQYVDHSLQEVVRWFSDGRDYVMGERFGVVDILLTSCLDWWLLYALPLPEPLGEYRDRIAQRPTYVAAMAQNNGIAGKPVTD